MEYVILIPTLFKYYEQIAAQLDAANICSYFYADAFMAHRFWYSYDRVSCMLADELSKASYWGAIYGLMSGDNTFVTKDPSPNYFALREFASAEGEIIVDVGAYVGDTIEEYLKKASGNVKIYAFEPFKSAINKLTERVKRLEREWMLDDNAIEIIPAGVGSETRTLRFSAENPSMLKIDAQGETTIPVYSLDDFFKDKPTFTLLKADIEGGEMDMLIGAKEIIKQYKPKMTICIYHSPQDFARIAEYIHSLVPEYRFNVRSHYSNYKDTVLYCTL
jgi:FkbM family methyltransferase